MKTKIEIEKELSILKSLSDDGQYNGSDTSEIDAKIVALQCVLGLTSDIFN